MLKFEITLKDRKMFKKFKLLLIVAVAVSFTHAKSDMYKTIESINKGLDGYVIGKELTAAQKKLSGKNILKSTNSHIKRFLANDNLLIAINAENNKVLAINKKLSNLNKNNIKALIAEYIHKFEEPTAMAHDKMIYWVYNKEGQKIAEDELKQYKDSLKVKAKSVSLAQAVNMDTKKVDFDPYVSVKLTSDKGLMSKAKEEEIANAYIMISSDKLISKILGIK